jgi:hypothetical protein
MISRSRKCGHAWIAAAKARGIDVYADPDGYLAVIAGLIDELESDATRCPNCDNLRLERGELQKEVLLLRYMVNKRQKLLQRVLQCGLCEEPHGVGFTPSRQERIAEELARDIGDELRGIDALVKA